MKNLVFWLFYLATLVIAGGCKSADHVSLTEASPPAERRSAVSFGKQEVLTRQWLTADGARMALIDFRIIPTTNGPVLAVVEYGDKRRNRIYCVDCYEYSEAKDPTNPVLDLLCHDDRAGWVSTLVFDEQKGGGYVKITRDSYNPQNLRTTRNRYSYKYGVDSGFTRTMEDIYSEHETPER